MRPLPRPLRRCLVVFLLLGFSLGVVGAAPAAPASAEDLFLQGNAAYQKGDFTAAAAAYQKIVDTGVQNSRVDFNLGNAFFRLNQIGKAILYYEKARRLDPGDEDVRENLRFANLHLRDRILSEKDPIVLEALRRGRDAVSPGTVSVLFLALYLSAMVLIALWILLRGRRGAFVLGFSAAALLTLALVSGGWLALQLQARGAGDEAIVLADKLEVLSGPGAENTLLASVHEGTKVRIHGRRAEWFQITLPDGRAGWIRGEGLGVV